MNEDYRLSADLQKHIRMLRLVQTYPNLARIGSIFVRSRIDVKSLPDLIRCKDDRF